MFLHSFVLYPSPPPNQPTSQKPTLLTLTRSTCSSPDLGRGWLYRLELERSSLTGKLYHHIHVMMFIVFGGIELQLRLQSDHPDF